MTQPLIAYLGLGSNLGRRLEHLRGAVDRLSGSSGIVVKRVSPVYESEAHTLDPSDTDPSFLNLVAEVETRLSPSELLDVCVDVERMGGRYREGQSWQPRTIDIDILLIADLVIQTDRLKLPHPRMADRRFVLLPLFDLAPDLMTPEPFSATVSSLLASCRDRLPIARRYSSNAVFNAGGS